VRLPPAILLDPSDNGLVLASSLRRRGVAVTILATPDYSWVARTRAASGEVLPPIRADRRLWLARLQRLGEGASGVLIPASDTACELVATERKRIPDALLSFEAADSSHLHLMDKDWTYRLAERLQIRYPRSWRLSSPEDLEGVAERVTYPCLLKPTISHRWRELFGTVRIIVLRSRSDLLHSARPPLAAGLSLLVSEYIPGPDRNLEAIVTVRRNDGTFALEYGRRKIRQQPPSFGGGTLQESIDPSDLRDLARRLLSEAAFVGVSSIEVKRHAESGEPVLIEVNVRVPQSWGVGDASGADASWRLYSTLAGLALPPQPRQALHVRSVVPTLEVHAIARAATGRQSLRRLIRTYRGVADVSGLSLRDPAPALALLRTLLASGARQILTGDLTRRMERYPAPPAAS
jgi:D-aspartate ligase